MNQVRINNYIENLHRQIDGSVANIRQKKSGSQNQDNSYVFFRLPEEQVSSSPYKLLDTQVSYSLSDYFSQNPIQETESYAASTYQNAADVMKKPTVLIDFMFEYNREFNFKV